MRYLTKATLAVTAILFVFLCNGCNGQSDLRTNSDVTTSEIRETADGPRIFLNGELFYVKGAGIDVEKGDLEALAAHGANSFRTWSMDKGKEMLDRADELGLKVMMGIWVGLERHGFDYNNRSAVKEQLKRIERQVEALKDHPALMMWGIGNEVNLLSQNPKVWNAVNDISKMIHKVDPHHLTTTSLSGLDQKDVALIASRAPDLDFVSVQLYAAIEVLPNLIERSGYKGPILVTEWGATGYWEVPNTGWGAPLENNSSQKADFYRSRYEKSIEGLAQQVMGSFVFFWGQKQERTPTWFGMFMPDGKVTESVDAMHYIWKGEWPANRTPRLHDFTLEGNRAVDNIKLAAGQSYDVVVDVTDPEEDALTYRWEVMQESNSTNTGGDAEYIPPVIPGLFPADAAARTSFKAPSASGAYRLFIYVDDGNDHVAHANIPFWVDGGKIAVG